MAFLPADDKQQNPNGQNQQAPQQADTTGGGSGGSAQAGSGGAGGPPASYGAGGTGWTNIQSYLNANQGNTNSSQALDKQASGALDQESQNLQTQSAQTKQQGQQQVEQNHMGQDQASKLISQASQLYPQAQAPAAQSTNARATISPGAMPADQGLTKMPTGYGAGYTPAATDPGQTYQGAIGELQSHLNAQYGGPSSFNYGMGADAQRVGGLGDDKSFQGYMQDVYNKAASPNGMGSGALALQGQLDTNNGALQDTRNSLLQKYAGLQGNVASTTADTNAALAQAKNQFGQDESDLKGYLSGQGDQSKQMLDAIVTQQQGLKNSAPDMTAGLAGDDATTYKDSKDYILQHGLADWQAPQITEANATGADPQRNQFNTIMDALGLNAQKINPDSNPIGQGAWKVNKDRYNQYVTSHALDNGL